MTFPGVEEFTGADGRRKAIAHGLDAAMAAMLDMLRKGGAQTVEIGWTSPLAGAGSLAATPPDGVPVTWYCKVTWHRGVRPTTRGESAATTDHPIGALDAVADVVRQLGATVTILPPVPDDPGSLT